MTDLKRIEVFIRMLSIDPASGCWIWRGRVGTDGYGDASLECSGELAWLLFRGPIRDRLHVCHSCDNRMCVNPGHLWLDSAQDNVADCINKGRRRYPRGAVNGASKLTDEIVIAIRNDTRPLAAIASEYHISTSSVSMIRNRKSWRHL